MMDLQVVSDFNDQKMLTTQGESEFRLPRIYNNPIRSQIRSKAQQKRKFPLPSLKQINQSNYEISEKNPSKSNIGDKERENFAIEIQQRLKMILENVQEKEGLVRQHGEEIDFEQAIMHNRQRIKEKKQQNQKKQKSKHAFQSEKQAYFCQKSINISPINIKKCIKDSSNDKYLQQKRKIIALKQEAIEKVRKINRERQMQPQRHDNSIPFPVRFVGKSKSKKSPLKIEPQISSHTAKLFDQIHNFLENPQKKNIKSKGEIQDLKTLQMKLQKINQKLGISGQQKILEGSGIDDYTVSDWKRFSWTKNNKLKCYPDSNFQKEVDRIQKLQQRGQIYLIDYLQQQRRIVELALMKKNDIKTVQIS